MNTEARQIAGIPEWQCKIFEKVKVMSHEELLREIVSYCSDRDGDICNEDLGVGMLNSKFLALEARCAALEGAVVVAISHLPEYGGRTARKILTETLRATDNGGQPNFKPPYLKKRGLGDTDCGLGANKTTEAAER